MGKRLALVDEVVATGFNCLWAMETNGMDIGGYGNQRKKASCCPGDAGAVLQLHHLELARVHSVSRHPQDMSGNSNETGFTGFSRFEQRRQ